MHPRRIDLRSLIFVALSLILLLASGASWAADPYSPRDFAPVQEGFNATPDKVLPYHPERILVQLTSKAFEDSHLHFAMERGAKAPSNRTGLATLDALCAEAGVKAIVRPYIQVANKAMANDLGLERWFMLETDGRADVVRLSRLFAADPAVQAASVDWVAFPAAVPSDPMHSDHWGHNNTAQLPDLDWGRHLRARPAQHRRHPRLRRQRPGRLGRGRGLRQHQRHHRHHRQRRGRGPSRSDPGGRLRLRR